MGRSVIEAVQAADGLVLAAVIDPAVAQLDLPGVLAVGSLADLPDGSCEVLVDFTNPDAARAQLAGALDRGFHLVVGTTGLGSSELEQLNRISAERGSNAVVAANFAIGAVLLMKFAAIAARYFDGVEIVELHHDQKVDAPSGTALKTAEAIADARATAGLGTPHDPTTTTILEGARGGNGPGGIKIHSVRLPGLVAHEEVLFGGPGQGLTLRHDSYDRSSFMAGVVLAIRAVGHRPGVTIGIDSLLEG